MDLDDTGLSHKIICDLLPSLQKSKALLGLHIGFNPGFDKTLRRIFMRKLKLKPKPKHSLDLRIKREQPVSPSVEKLYHMEGIELGGIRREKEAYRVTEEG